MITLLLTLLGCGGAEAPVVSVTLAGSSTVEPVASIAGDAFQKAHPGSRIDVQGGGSSVGISSARSGLADIGMVSRALKPEEADLTATTIGLDGIALIVHAENPLAGLETSQVVSLYTGEITRWSSLGGADHEITLVNKEAGRSTLELFEGFFDVKGKIAKSALIIGPNGQAITTVAGNRFAIAYVSIGSAAFAEAQGTPIRRVPLNGVDASVENVANRSYPLMRPLNLVTKGAPSPNAQRLLDFVLSAEGQALVAKEDFVPVAGALATTTPVVSAPPAL